MADRTGGARARPMLRESVYESIKAMLMDNDLAPDSRVSIDGLARQLKVSPTPVREALFRCEAEGLVVRRPNAGYSVAPLLDRAALEDLFDVRLLLEPVSARRAAQQADDNDRADFRAAVETVTPVEGDGYAAYRDFAAADAQFHLAIAAAAGNPRIVDILVRARPQTHGFRLHFHHEMAAQTVSEHKKILDALLERDADAAEASMRAHLQASRRRLTRLSSPQAGTPPRAPGARAERAAAGDVV